MKIKTNVKAGPLALPIGQDDPRRSSRFTLVALGHSKKLP